MSPPYPIIENPNYDTDDDEQGEEIQLTSPLFALVEV